MVYGDMTYEVILDRMLDRVSESNPNLDAREGSIIYNALAPAALELAIAYVEMDNGRSESFVDTASREYILLRCKELGIDTSVFDATYGVHKGKFNVEVPIGSRWNCDLYNYEVTEYMGLENGNHAYRMVCEMEGSEPNNYIGDLTPIDNVPNGLSYASLVGCLIEGENETSDEAMKEYYYNQAKNDGVDGNVAQYVKWCEGFDGIGNYKIIPLWNGSNTVKVSILNATNGVASKTLVDDFQEYLDPGVEGMGNGVAPIGAFVTVSTATETPLSITADVVLASGYTDPNIINSTLADYLASIAYKKSFVSYMQIGAAILDTEGVEFITNLKVNGGTSDITLGDEGIPTLGATEWTVVS